MALAYHDEAKMGNRDAQVVGASLDAKTLVVAREGVEVMALAYHDVLVAASAADLRESHAVLVVEVMGWEDEQVEVKSDDELVVAKRVARHDEQGSARGTKHLREFLVLFLQHLAAEARDDVQELAASLAYLYWQT